MKGKQHLNKDLQFAFSTLYDYFDNYSLKEGLRLIESIFKAATNDKEWKQGPPSDLLYFSEQLQNVTNVVYDLESLLVHDEDYILDELTPTKNPESLKSAKFVGRGHFSDVWNCFPRHLTLNQLGNPTIVLKKFVSFIPKADCGPMIRDIVFFALSKDSMDDEYPGHRMLKIRKYLLQAIEACHLIHVRNQSTK